MERIFDISRTDQPVLSVLRRSLSFWRRKRAQRVQQRLQQARRNKLTRCLYASKLERTELPSSDTR